MPGLRLADHVVAAEQLRDRLLLDRRRLRRSRARRAPAGSRRLRPRSLKVCVTSQRGSSSSLPLVRRAGEVLVRAARLGERVDAADRRPRARRRRPRRAARRSSARPASRRGEQVDEPEADHRRRVAQQVRRCETSLLLARGDPEDDHAPERRQRAAARRRRRRRRSSARTASTCSPPLASRIAAPRSSARESTRRVGAEPRGQLALLLARGERRSPWPPARLASCTASVPVPPAARLDDDRLARLEPGAAVDQRVRGQALEQQRRRLVVVDLVGDRDQPAPRARRPSRA